MTGINIAAFNGSKLQKFLSSPALGELANSFPNSILQSNCAVNQNYENQSPFISQIDFNFADYMNNGQDYSNNQMGYGNYNNDNNYSNYGNYQQMAPQYDNYAMQPKKTGFFQKIRDFLPIAIPIAIAVLKLFGKDEKPDAPLNNWENECADSISDVDKNGKNVYSKDVKPLDFVGDDYRAAVKAKDFTKARDIYKEKGLDVAKKEIALYDKDGDGVISSMEQVLHDREEATSRFGELDAASIEKLREVSLRTFTAMDLDKKVNPNNIGIDANEYTAFIKAMNSNNSDGTANGRITREEYDKSTNYFTKTLDNEAGTFIGSIRSAYKSLFGNDPGVKAS